MGQRKKPEQQQNTKRVAIGGQSDELYLISKFRELSPARQADVLMLVDLFIDLHPPRTSQRLKLVKPKPNFRLAHMPAPVAQSRWDVVRGQRPFLLVFGGVDAPNPIEIRRLIKYTNL